MVWTADDLVTSVKRRGQFPDANGALTDADILAIADEVMLEEIEPVLTKPGSEYLLQTKDVSLVAGTAEYRLPARAIVSKLRDLWYIDESGNERQLDQISHERAPVPAGQTGSDPIDFYLRGEHVVLRYTPSAAGGRKLRMRYYLRRPRLVLVAAAPRITAINTGTKVLTASIPTTWTNANLVDLIHFGGLFDHLGLDLVVTAVDGGFLNITLSAALPADLAVGDYVSLAGESSVLCIPVELHPALVSLTLARALRALGDPRAGAEEDAAAVKLAGLAPLFQPRVDGTAPKMVPRFSPLRNGGGVWG